MNTVRLFATASLLCGLAAFLPASSQAGCRPGGGALSPLDHSLACEFTCSGGACQPLSHADCDKNKDGWCVICGTKKEDHIVGTDGADVICGGGSNDVITGGNSCTDPTTCGDLIDGGSGNDNILGTDGNDSIFGGRGNDDITGGGGGDSLFGQGGNDTVWAGGLWILGSTPPFTVLGTRLCGGRGNDALVGSMYGHLCFDAGPDQKGAPFGDSAQFNLDCQTLSVSGSSAHDVSTYWRCSTPDYESSDVLAPPWIVSDQTACGCSN